MAKNDLNDQFQIIELVRQKILKEKKKSIEKQLEVQSKILGCKNQDYLDIHNRHNLNNDWRRK